MKCYYDQLVLLITEEPNESQNIILINIFFCVHYKIFYVILFPEMFLVLYNRKVILLWWPKPEESIKLLFYKTVHRTHGLAAKWFRIQDLKGNKAFLTTISLIAMHGNYSRTKYQIITFQGNINAIHILNIYYRTDYDMSYYMFPLINLINLIMWQEYGFINNLFIVPAYRSNMKSCMFMQFIQDS